MKGQNNHTLIIEQGDDGLLWGRVLYDDDLVVESAKTVDELQHNLKGLLVELHGVKPESVEFEVQYDLAAFFEQFDFLKITKIAELTGINGSLMRQYASGNKYPGKKQKEKIEQAIRSLGQKLSSIVLLQEA